MKKIVSNGLVVCTQLIVGGLFLFMLFSDNNENSKVVMIENNNLNKMSDAVNELFIIEQVVLPVDTTSEEELISAEEKQRQEEEILRLAAEEEAARIAAEQEAARLAAEQEAARVAAEQEAARIAAEQEAAKNAVIVNANGYLSKPAMGFNVTTGNKTYTLTEEEFNIVAGVVACEAAGPDDALAVMSVILNRADSARYPNDPVGVVSAPNQFSCYLKRRDPARFASVVRDALNGVRNNSYYSFNCPNCSPYIANYIVDNGNWFY